MRRFADDTPEGNLLAEANMLIAAAEDASNTASISWGLDDTAKEWREAYHRWLNGRILARMATPMRIEEVIEFGQWVRDEAHRYDGDVEAMLEAFLDPEDP